MIRAVLDFAALRRNFLTMRNCKSLDPNHGPRSLHPSACSRPFAKVSDRGTPTAGLVLTGAIILGLAVSGTFELLIRFMSFFTLIVDGIVLTSVIALRRRMPNANRPFRVPAYPVIPVLAVVLYATVLGIIIVTQPKLALGGTAVLLVIAGAVWFGVKGRR